MPRQVVESWCPGILPQLDILNPYLPAFREMVVIMHDGVFLLNAGVRSYREPLWWFRSLPKIWIRKIRG